MAPLDEQNKMRDGDTPTNSLDEPLSATQHLQSNAVGLAGNWILSIANVAPSASVAFTLALLISFAGLGSPLVIVVVGIAMFLVAMAYSRLNNWRPQSGAPYTWIGASVSPAFGYSMGLLMIIASLFSNIGNITLAGTYALGIVSPTATFPGPVVWLVATAIMGLCTFVAVRGIRPSVKLQLGLMGFEYIIVILFAVLILLRELVTKAPGTTSPSLSVFTIAASPTGFTGLLGATVAAAFLFAGWETPLYLGEEARERHVNPGRAARLGVLFVLVWYTILVVIFQGMASRHDILAHGSDALSYAGTLALPQPWARLISVAVILAVVAVTQVLLIVGSRLILAMARDGLLPERLGRVHPRYKTPWIATIVLALIPVIVLIPYLISSGASTAIGDVISSGGLFYLLIYGIVAGTCVWYYRRSIRRGTAAVLVSVVLPLIGGAFLLYAFVDGVRTQTAIVSVVVGVIVVLCLIVGIWGRYSLKTSYFEQRRQADREPVRDSGSRT